MKLLSAPRGSHSAVQIGEIALEMGREVGGFYWDIEKFYDFIPPLLVMTEMVAFRFDPVFLAISMQFHLASGVRRRDGHHSAPVATASSIFAGMKQSRMYDPSCLVALLEEVHNMVPAVATQDYGHELAQREEHKVASVAAEHACDAALHVAEWFDNRWLKVSPKTAVAAPRAAKDERPSRSKG